MEEKYVIATNLAYYRKLRGLSQLELASKLNYSNKNISKWENGETTPSVFVLKKIASLYGISVDALLVDNIDNAKIGEELKSHQDKKRKRIFEISFLLLANAILFAVASVIIYILGVAGVTVFNKWLMYLYISPLTALTIYIFIRVKRKYVEVLSLSAVGWFICASIYATIPNETAQLVFLLGFAYEALVVCVALVINTKLVSKFANKIKEIKAKKRNKN